MPVTRVDLAVPDLDRAVRLFGSLLGGEPAAGEGDGVLLRRADADAAVALSPTTARTAALQRLVVGVDDVAAVAARVGDRRGIMTTAAGAVVVHAEELGTEVVLTQDAARAARGAGTGPLGRAATTAFDHVCFAVPSLAAGVHLLRDVLGGDMVFGGRNERLGTLSSQVAFGPGTRVELLQPLHEGARIARFLARRGPGLHHLTWHVADVATAEAAALAAAFDVVDTDLGSRSHWHETYVRPSAAMGLLVQLAWTDRHHDRPLADDEIAAVLAGRVDSEDFTMRPV